MVGIANSLLKAIKEGKGHEIIKKIVTELREYTVHHFYDEEKYMGKIKYPKLAEHQGEHARLTRQVKGYQHAMYKKQEITAEEVRDFLKTWLLDHILKSDMQIAAFVREKQEAQAPEPADEKAEPGKDIPAAGADD